MTIDLPLEIADKTAFPQVKRVDRQIIRAAVLLRLDNQTAYALYHPELLDGAGKLGSAGKTECRNFWSYGKNREYREAYERTLAEFLGARKSATAGDLAIDDTRKDRALRSLLNQAMQMVEGGAELDADTLKTVTEIFRKLGILKDEVEVQEAPRRYLPATCSACEYKRFIDEQVALGNIAHTEE